MGDVVSLNRHRKEKARQAKQSRAAANRIRHGTPGTARKQSRHELERSRRDLDGKRLDRAETTAAGELPEPPKNPKRR